MPELVPAGQDAGNPQTGDLLLVEKTGPIQSIIRFGQWIRPSLRPWSNITHVVCVRSPDGALVEALTRGVVYSCLPKYRNARYVHVRTGLDRHDQAQAGAFLDACVGQEYGFANDLGIGMRFLTPGPGYWFGANGTQNCSGLGAQMLCRGSVIFPSEPSSLCPAELGKFYNVQLPKEET